MDRYGRQKPMGNKGEQSAPVGSAHHPGLPGYISPYPGNNSITYNLEPGSHLISFPFRAWEYNEPIDLYHHLSNDNFDDGVGFMYEEGVWPIEEFISMMGATSGEISQIIGQDYFTNQGIAAILHTNGQWVGSLEYIVPQMAYWIKVESPINTTVNAPDGMINRKQNLFTHYGPNMRAYPFPDKPEYRDIEPYDTNIVTNHIANAGVTNKLIGSGVGSQYHDEWGWTGSFKFNPGEGFIMFVHHPNSSLDYAHSNGQCGGSDLMTLDHLDSGCPELFRY